MAMSSPCILLCTDGRRQRLQHQARKAKPKDKVPSITLTVMFSWAISTMTKQMVKASMFTETAKFTKDSGSMICNMATVGKKCQMEVHLKGNSQEVARMVMDFIDGLIRRCTRVSGSRVR